MNETARTIDELRASLKRLLAFLGDGQWHSQQELTEVAGMRYGGRIHELREAGHNVESQQLGPRRWFYRLRPSAPTDTTDAPEYDDFIPSVHRPREDGR